MPGALSPALRLRGCVTISVPEGDPDPREKIRPLGLGGMSSDHPRRSLQTPLRDEFRNSDFQFIASLSSSLVSVEAIDLASSGSHSEMS